MNTAVDDPEMLAIAPSATVRALARGQREERPRRRDLVTHALRLAGHSVHVSVGFRPDGTILEFFVDLHKEGAPMRGAAHIVATMGSRMLQHGVPVAAVCGSMRSTFFEPAGEVTGHERIVAARSLFDLVAQVLEHEASGT